MYGSSAGAINATYFLSGQREGVNIYTDEIACKEFIDLGRLLNFSGKPQGECLHCTLATQAHLDHSACLCLDRTSSHPDQFVCIGDPTTCCPIIHAS